jgi:hypothetical protein
LRFSAARKAASLTLDISASLYEALDDLTHRAQQAGLVRADLVADDLPRLIAMLHSVLFTMDSASDGFIRGGACLRARCTAAMVSATEPLSGPV